MSPVEQRSVVDDDKHVTAKIEEHIGIIGGVSMWLLTVGGKISPHPSAMEALGSLSDWMKDKYHEGIRLNRIRWIYKTQGGKVSVDEAREIMRQAMGGDWVTTSSGEAKS